MYRKKMYYGRRYGARRIQRAYRRYRKRRYKKKSLYKQVKKLKQVTYNNLQKGWVDTYTSVTAINSSGLFFQDAFGLETLASTNVLPQGRIGNKIVLKTLSLNMLMANAPSDLYNEVRLLLVEIKDMCVTAPIIQNILQTNDLRSFYAKNSPVKYKIHWDKTLNFSNFNQSVTQAGTTYTLAGMPYPNWRRVKKKFKFNKGKGLPIWYKNATAGTPIKSNLLLLAISDSSDGLVTGHPAMDIMARITFDP